MLLYIDEYQTVTHNREMSLIEMEWKKTSSKLVPESYMKRFQNVATYMEQYRPKNLLANLENMVFKGGSDLKEWLRSEVYKRFNRSGVQRVAFINSQDTITRLLIEEALSEYNNERFETKYFDSSEHAKSWLMGRVATQ